VAYYFRSADYHAGARAHPAPGATRIGAGYGFGETFRFITSAPLVVHDACANANGIRDHADGSSDGRESFGQLAGGDLCWSPVYSLSDDAPPCFYCGEPVKGRE
jgi:hypothetical protein